MPTSDWKALRASSDVLPHLRRAFGLGVVGLIAVAASFAALDTVQRNLHGWVVHSREVSRLGRVTRAFATERLAGARALQITRDLSTVGPEVAAHRALAPTLDSLVALTRDNPGQSARVGEIQAALLAWDEGFLKPLLRNLMLEARGEPTVPLADLTGNVLFEPVRSAFRTFIDEEERLFAARLANASRFRWIMMAIMLGELTLLAGVLTVLMRRALDQAHQVVAQQAQLEDDATELELQSSELSEQAIEVEEQMERARVTADQLRRANDTLTTSIAQRDRAVSDLGKQQHFLRQVIDTIPHFVFAKDRQGRFTLANEAVASVMGTTPDALIGKTDAEMNPNVEEAEHFVRDDIEVMDSLATRHVPEEFITDSSGKTLCLQTVKRALVNADGTADQILGVSTDITERRGLEKQLLQAQKMEAVGRLAGGVAHDFNNLLTVITSYADLLLSGLELPQHREDVEEIRRAAERATALTRQLLAFSRKQVLQASTVSPNTVVEGVEKMLGRLIGADVSIVTALAPDVGMVNADAGQIEQVIMNLAVNARDAMPNGGRITIETANVELDGSAMAKGCTMPPGSYVMLAVSDTGHGMNAEVLEHVFEPFFTTKAAGQGTGLGLSTVFGIVRQSGGDVWVYSEVGEGTTFKVYLPRVKSAPVLAGVTAIAASPRGAETILLAEDDEALRALARRVLADQGYTVLEARNGREAVALCRSHTGPIDLILSDIVMPELGGRGLAEALAGTRPNTPVLLMSGYTDDDVLRRALIDHRTAFLQKPFTPLALSKRVRAVLDAA